MGKFFSHEYWAQNVAKIYKILSKVAFFIVMICGYVGAGIFIIGGANWADYDGGIAFLLFAVGIILALITPFLAGVVSLTPLITVTVLEKLSRNEENTRWLLAEYCYERYKSGSISKEEYEERINMLKR